MNKKYSDEWFEKAHKDFKTVIELASKEDDDYHEIIAFHCQQNIEKNLKGFLAFHNKPIDKTHSLEKILREVNEIDDFSSVKNIIGLTAFAVNIRYPGENIIFTDKELGEIINLCKKVKAILGNYLSDERLL